MPSVLADKIASAHALLDETIERYVTAEGKELRGIVVLFSGGNDSTLLAHLMRDRATHLAHANTTIGIEKTREFVRKVAADWGLPLLEKLPPNTYRELVLDQGFLGRDITSRCFSD